MIVENTEIFGLIKPKVDAHTLGIHSAAQLLQECGYEVVLAEENIESALNDIRHEPRRRDVINWVQETGITRLGISYRLDPGDAEDMMGYLVEELKRNRLFHFQGGVIRGLFYAGLPEACKRIGNQWEGLVRTFSGGESPSETLTLLEIPKDRFPQDMVESSGYDQRRMAFGHEIIKRQQYMDMPPPAKADYPTFGTAMDSVTDRMDHQNRIGSGPLMRAHVGPYHSDQKREESVREFISWTKELATAGYLDILSIGTSQLTQSDFGKDWQDQPNGGGVPVNSAEEYRQIWEAARPMLVRTYAGTRNIPELARLHEENLHICWHALSLWWFNQLDNRGPYSLLENLEQQFGALQVIAGTHKPFEPNVPHHFSFRGGDDVTYLVSAYLSAKLAKKKGIRTLILQNMLNTPRATWGIQDLAKSRALLTLLQELTDGNFRFYLQPRAGLDYFSPDLELAKAQLASVTALMDDIDPHNEMSPPIIHVVSYSEASHLATPEIINESIRITQHSLRQYRERRRRGDVEDMSLHPEVLERARGLVEEARTMILAIEKSMADPYTPEGFYWIFRAGFLPVPYLWHPTEEFVHASQWKTKWVKGGIKVVDEWGKPVSAREIGERATTNLRTMKEKNHLFSKGKL
jgi:hypothetical protein